MGGAASVAGGGSFASGALSGDFGAAVTPVTIMLNQQVPYTGLAITTAVGGTTSALGGGTFAQGAMNAGLGYLYNACGLGEHGCSILGGLLGTGAGVVAAGACDAGTMGACVAGNPAIVGAAGSGGAAVGAALDIVFNEGTKTPNTGEPGAWVTNPGSGQERLYGPDGKPAVDIDFAPPHNGIQPHAHNWEPSSNGGFPVRGEGVPVPPLPPDRKPSQ